MKPHLKNKIPSYLFLLGLLGIAVTGFGQHKAYFIGNGEAKLHKIEAAADKAFDNGKYYTAFKLYALALESDSLKLRNQQPLSESARAYRAFNIAADAFTRLIAIDTANFYPIAEYRFLEMAEHKATTESEITHFIEEFEFLTETMESDDLEQRTAKHIRNLKFRLENQKINNPNQPIKLNPSVNTKWAELNPVWRNGHLYYGSLAYEKDKCPGKKFAKTLKTNGTNPSTEWDAFNIPNKSTTHLTFTPDDSRMYFTICDYIEEALICQLYYKDKIAGTVDDWGAAIKLPSHINYQGITNTQPACGEDEFGQPVLYFVSNRPTPDCKGGMDIWYTKIDETGEFSPPLIMDNGVNTEYNEITPFYHFRSRTLYFSSDCHPNYGGYDINKIAIREDASWTTIENLGYPYNSNHDDYDYFLKNEEDKAYFVSNRDGCEDDIAFVGCNDIYAIDIPPCITNINVCVFDAKTERPLETAQVILAYYERPIEPSSKVSNCTYYREVENAGRYYISSTANCYEPSSRMVEVLECTDTSFNIFLTPKAPILKVSVFGEVIKGENYEVVEKVPLSNATFVAELDLIKKVYKNKGMDIIISNKSNFVFYDMESNDEHKYKVTINHPNYSTGSTEIFNADNGCDTIYKEVILKLKPILEAPIVCYFDHDVPNRNRNVNYVVDTLSTYSYSNYYDDYKEQSDYYVQEFTTVPLQDRQPLIKDFFQMDVILNNTQLKAFRERVYNSLLRNPMIAYNLTIRGYCSNSGTSEYNVLLAKRRVDSVGKFFLESFGDNNEKQIDTSRINFVTVPVGETDEPGVLTFEDRINQKFNPISNRKRRVEVESITLISNAGISTSNE